ncbi:AI-2E family transporter [Amphibacillus sediminis]|uniref:AI-2E family transporter n=1 Tax=Amphibacillus sediminis TaxID=360185 RepID=UPI0035709C86
MSVVSNEQDSRDNQRIIKLTRYGILIIIGLIILFLIRQVFPDYPRFLLSLYKIILPFFLSGLLAYLFKPIIARLIQLSLPRWLAIIVLYLTIAGAIGLALYYTYPVLIKQIETLEVQLPELLEGYRGWLNRIDEMLGFFPEHFHDQIDSLFARFEQSSAHWLEQRILGLTGIGEYLISLAVVPVLLYYLLLDTNKIKAKMMNSVPKRYQKRVKQMLGSVDHNLGKYIRGQLLICLFIAITTYILYKVINLEYSLILALFMGVMNIVPYFGPIIGALPAVLIALTMSGKTVIYVILGIFVLQQIESSLLAPLILGRSVHAHPLLVILALLIGSELAGILGMILAVPILVVIRELFKFNLFEK